MDEGGGGINGGGFGAQMSVNVTGNGAGQLALLAASFNTANAAAVQFAANAQGAGGQVGALAGGLNIVTGAAGQTAMAVSDAANQINLLLESSLALQQVGSQMMHFGDMMLHGVIHPFSEAIHEAGELETQSIALRSAFRDLNDTNFDVLQKRIQGISITSPFPMKQINEIVTSLKNVGNVDLSQMYAGTAKKAKETGISFMTDLAAGTGRSLEDVLFSVRMMLSETGERAFLSFKHRLHMGGSDAMKAVLAQAGESFDMSTPQKRLETLFKFISIKFGGLTEKLTGSAEGIVTVIKDIVRVGVFNAIQESFQKYKGTLLNIRAFLDSLFSEETDKAKAFRETFKGVLTAIGDVFAGIADRGVKVARAITDWMGQNPELSKFFAKVYLGAGAFLVLAGSVLLVVGTAGKLIAMLGGIAGGLRLGIGLLGNVVMGLRAVSFAAFLLVGVPYLLYQAYRTNFGGIADTIDHVLKVFEGLFQLIGSNQGEVGHMSKALADELKGIKGFFGDTLFDDVVSLFMLFGRLRQAVIGFQEGFGVAIQYMKVIFEPVFKVLFHWLVVIADWLGVKLVHAGRSNVEKWKDFGRIAGALVPVLLVAIGAFRMASVAISGLKMAVDIAKGAFALFTAVLELNPLVLLATAIALVVAGLILWANADEDMRNQIKEGWSALVNYVVAELESLTGWDFSGLKNALLHPIDAAKEAWHNFKEYVKDFDATSVSKQIRDAIVPAMDGIIVFFKDAKDDPRIRQFFHDFASIWGTAIEVEFTAAKFILKMAYSLARAIVEALMVELAKHLLIPPQKLAPDASGKIPEPPASPGIIGNAVGGFLDWVDDKLGLYTTRPAADSGIVGSPNFVDPMQDMPFQKNPNAVQTSVPVQQGPGTSTASSTGGQSGQVKVSIKHEPQTIQLLLDGRMIYAQMVRHDDQEYVRDFGSNEEFAP